MLVMPKVKLHAFFGKNDGERLEVKGKLSKGEFSGHSAFKVPEGLRKYFEKKVNWCLINWPECDSL